ncbi:MAG: hypothetical protein Q9209_001658 [Squamulea sp. 1 TL-2023]
MDPLSIIASAIPIIHTIDKALGYVKAVKNGPKECARLIEELQSLQVVLKSYQELSERSKADCSPTATSPLSTLSWLAETEDACSPLARCREELEVLLAEFERFGSAPEGSTRIIRMQALSWPLKHKEISSSFERLERLRRILEAGLSNDHLGVSLDLRSDIKLLKEQASSIQDASLRHKIYQWLSAPDPSVNHATARAKVEPTTGQWFLKSQQYTHWQAYSNSSMWLHGIPGCGKTILSSTIITDLNKHRETKEGRALVYYYFDFNDVEKQDCWKMLRSCLLQLSMQHTSNGRVLESLYHSCNKGQGQPTNNELLDTFKNMLEPFNVIYVVLDALDECKTRADLLAVIREITCWCIDGLHLLFTSRREGRLGDNLGLLVHDDGIIDIQSSLVEDDIRALIRSRLSSDDSHRGMRRWCNRGDVKDMIESRLMEKADGLFRWVACQLDRLEKCLSPRMLNKTLASLPVTLEETYERILIEIEEMYKELTVKALQWIVHSERPLRLEELADALAVDVECQPRFDNDARISDPRDLLLICSSLIDVTSVDSDERKVVKLAHFSVKEYLVSDNIRLGRAAIFAVDHINTHMNIAKDCLAYLIHTAHEGDAKSRSGSDTGNCGKVDENDENQTEISQEKRIAAFPLVSYAAEYWMHHVRVAKEQPQSLFLLLLELFEPCDSKRWLWDVNRFPLRDTEFSRGQKTDWTRLASAGRNNLPRLTRHLLAQGVDPNFRPACDNSLLQIAAAFGHIEIIKVLLEFGANINAAGAPFGGTALWYAAHRGLVNTVEFLLDRGAEIELLPKASIGTGHNALISAAKVGHLQVVQILLSKGANINATAQGMTALRLASQYGHTPVVQLLLSEGASIDFEYNSDALPVAAYYGREETVSILIAAGIDVNVCHYLIGTPLQGASTGGSLSISQHLIASGADVNIKGGRYGTALQAAAYEGHLSMMELLLASGADANIRGGEYGGALQAACLQGYEFMVRLLLDHGIDINAYDEGSPSPLQCACIRGHESIARSLIDRGASPCTLGGYYGSALHAAAAGGYHTIVNFLLERGAEVDAYKGIWGTPLQAALGGGYLEAAYDEKYGITARRLLQAGAEPKVDFRLEVRLGEVQQGREILLGPFEPYPPKHFPLINIHDMVEGLPTIPLILPKEPDWGVAEFSWTEATRSIRFQYRVREIGPNGEFRFLGTERYYPQCHDV